MSDAQALSRWLNKRLNNLRADPDQRNIVRYMDAINRLSVTDAIRLFAFTLLTGTSLPDLDKIKEGEG